MTIFWFVMLLVEPWLFFYWGYEIHPEGFEWYTMPYCITCASIHITTLIALSISTDGPAE